VTENNLRRNALVILRRAGIGEYAKPFHTLRKCRISEVALEYPQGVLEEWFGHDEDVSRIHYQRVPEELYKAPRGVGHSFGHKRTRNARTTHAPPAPRKRQLSR
jgi:hypothetical protein